MANFCQEQLDAQCNTMLDNALATVSKWDKLVAAVADNGPELLYECLAELEPLQVINITRKLAKQLSRQCYTAVSAIQREQEKAVRRGGVDSYEVSFSELVSDYQGREFEEGAPQASLLMECAHLLYVDLQTAYLIAEKIAFGWRDDYSFQGLPWHSYSDDGETWFDIYTLEEALVRLDVDRQIYREEQRRKDLGAIGRIRAIGKRGK